MMRYPLSAPNAATDIKLNMIAAGPEITGAKNITPKPNVKYRISARLAAEYDSVQN